MTVALRRATPENLPQLQSLYEEACACFAYDPGHGPTPPDVCLASGDLPPGGDREHFSLLGVWVAGTLSGYLTLYRGYPDSRTAYLAFLYMADAVKGGGVGSRVVQLLSQQLAMEGYAALRLCVSLKNWAGLRFWVRCGFDHITRVAGDAIYRPEGYGCLELQKTFLN